MLPLNLFILYRLFKSIIARNLVVRQRVIANISYVSLSLFLAVIYDISGLCSSFGNIYNPKMLGIIMSIWVLGNHGCAFKLQQ